MKEIQFYCILVSIVLLQLSSTVEAQKTPRLPVGISESTIKAHKISPADIRGIIAEDDDDDDSPFLSVKHKRPLPSAPKINVKKFGEALHQYLKDSVNGYVMQLSKNGQPVYSLKWKWARKPSDGYTGWDFNTRMHVASVSKYLTAVGVMKALKLKNLSVDEKIINYLPRYWDKGANIDRITFRHLLTHRSGFKLTGNEDYATDYSTMRSKVAAGVNNPGENSGYENINFGLCRILLPILMGYIDKEFMGPEEQWDGYSVAWFNFFMQQNIFTPAGVSSAGFLPQGPNTAYAYSHPGAEPAWNSGNLTTVSGAAGWRLSVTDLLKVMNNLRRKGNILSASEIQDGLDDKLGIDKIYNTAGGKLYCKNGRWRNGARTEQSVIFFMPDNMELAIFVNSRIGLSSSDGTSLRGLIKKIYEESLE